MKELDITEIDLLIDGPLYVLVAGAAGVGKSTIVERHVKTIKMMDVDYIISEIGNGVYNRDNAGKAFEIIAKRIDLIMARKESFIAMGTAANMTQTAERLTEAKKAGYLTIMVHIKAPLEQILEQNRQRIENGERGVKLDEEHKIEEMFIGSNYTVNHLGKTPLIDYLVEYDNTRDL